MNYKSFSKGYAKYCSQQCVSKIRSKKFQEKYGVSHPLKLEQFRKKAKKTSVERHGNANYNNREKSKRTNLKKYGVENPTQCKTIKEKIEKTNIKKYGFKSPLLNENVQKKTWKTLTKKYNLKDDHVNVFQIKEVKEKIKRTNLKKYGVEFNSQRHVKNLENLNEKYIRDNFVEENGYVDIEEIQKYFSISYSFSYSKLKELGIKIENKLSNGEKGLRNYLETFGYDLVFNDKTIIQPYEIDIYVPELNFGIEHNGLYWHCDVVRSNKNFHVKKTNMCEKKGVQLLHVFGHQWNDYFTRDIIKSMIANKFNKCDKIYARKCKILEVSNEDKNDFLNENHLQGQQQSKINFGLFYNDELVSLMTFGKSRFNTECEWELLRFCNKKYTRVIGGASKLLKKFITKYKGDIVSYADRSYSNGNLYKKLGFKKNKINGPSYFYFKGNEIINRLKVQKKKLENFLDDFDPNLTEYQNMINNGYNRVWTCGTIQYILKT